MRNASPGTAGRAKLTSVDGVFGEGQRLNVFSAGGYAKGVVQTAK